MTYLLRSTLLVAGTAALALLLASCDVDPYCISCGDAGEVEEDAGRDAGPRRDAANGFPDAEPLDAGDDADAGGCLALELCNQMDDDCDGNVDEGIQLSQDPNNCGSCGNVCQPAHAFATCQDGTCIMGDCDVGWQNLDGDPSNGCEYRCTMTDVMDALCDLRDNDCDGAVDEDVEFDTDIMNCGSCGRLCRFNNAAASCMAGECVLGECEENFYDTDENPDNGCEFSCTPSEDPTEICDNRDNDCDRAIDERENDVPLAGEGDACGSEVGACQAGVTGCVNGAIICTGATAPTTELCNGINDDCDVDDMGMELIDEGNPEGGRLCGSSTGVCVPGREQCMGGELVCVGATLGTDELCNGLDDDCDGMTDEGNPEGGAPCGATEGACEAGMLTCEQGALFCRGGVVSAAEQCNNADDDCDGMTDEGNPGGGALCGTDVGVCSPGVEQCMGGAIVCEGETTGVDELCDTLDNDCDGEVDEGNPQGGDDCGTNVGACEFGSFMCNSGALICVGGTGPGGETCNSVDDDCDGDTDEDFNINNDIRNCGMCGRACSFPNATPTCNMGTCEVASCETGFYDITTANNNANGCEYECDYRGSQEICNNRDEDCDGTIDEDLNVPAGFCNQRGVCAGTTASCDGANGWVCQPTTLDYEPTEVSCDDLDNDCDGDTDETHPLKGADCSNGLLGTCRRTSTFQCTTDGSDVVCPAASLNPTPGTESCNNRDDDCDGMTDEAGAQLTASIPTVTMSLPGGNVRVMRYEASRPDASPTSGGTVGTVACSRAGVRPWTSVSYTEARNACCALNAGGTCPAPGGTGWQVCEAEDWEAACEGPMSSCTWAYRTSCSMSQPTACNGKEVDSDATLPGDQDAVRNTGAFPECRADWGGTSATSIFDLSGNVKEWTNRARVQDGVTLREIRGGSYTSIEAGRECTFDFTAAPEGFRHPDTGFRCCYYE